MAAFARASAKGSPMERPSAAAAALSAAMRGPPVASTARMNGRCGSTGLTGLRACAARNRRIGQRGSQTETMRDMIKLHYPFVRSSVAAALQLQPPPPAHDQAETVARGLGGADAP